LDRENKVKDDLIASLKRVLETQAAHNDDDKNLLRDECALLDREIVVKQRAIVAAAAQLELLRGELAARDSVISFLKPSEESEGSKGAAGAGGDGDNNDPAATTA
jgi:hypothetical protein